MPKAQVWLNQNYSIKNQTIIDAKSQKLSGKLTIQDFPNLEKIDFSNNKDLTTIELINLPSLKHFKVNNCQINNITITACPNLTYFNIGNNLLTKTDFLSDLNPKKLTHLSIHSNNFSKQKLDFLSQFTNLEELYLDNSNEENFCLRTYNHFYGSLRPLQNLTKLKWLSLAKTDIDNGLEYLPISVRKIGLKKDWGSDNDSNCIKIVRELEKVAKVSGGTEQLTQEEENEPISVRGKATWYRLAPWHQAYELLGEEEFKKQISQQNAQIWLDKYFPKEATNDREKRENIIFLNLNGKNLVGHLDLRDFTSLESLSCLGNKLTSLDLSRCTNLIKTNCSSNKFDDTYFLGKIPNKEKLEILRINKNEELKENLNFLTPFTGLKELNVEDCSFYGSLEPLKGMKNLKKIFLSRTHINQGLEYLPDSCKELYCDYDYQYKSSKIADELSKFVEDRHYDVAKWQEDKQNDMIAFTISLERLYVIRGNMRQFLKKWGLKKENSVSELSVLQSSEELWKHRLAIYITQFVGRSAGVAGAILTFQNQSAVGGGIVAIYPIAELVVSKLEQILKDKKSKWKEFLTDADTFLDNYHELSGILVQFEIDELKGAVNKKLKALNENIKEFLDIYDQDNNGEIDVEELIDKRGDLAQELNKKENKVQEIIDSIKQLEETMIEYRKTSHYIISEKKAVTTIYQPQVVVHQP